MSQSKQNLRNDGQSRATILAERTSSTTCRDVDIIVVEVRPLLSCGQFLPAATTTCFFDCMHSRQRHISNDEHAKVTIPLLEVETTPCDTFRGKHGIVRSISEENTRFKAKGTERNADVAESFVIQRYAVSCDRADGMTEHVSRFAQSSTVGT